MYIKKLHATFGCLENKTLELSPGLNIITAPNESGKSTWSAFIRTMLFGISTREKARAGHLPDKERYRSWSGSAMYGRMELCKGGADIEIERKSRFDIFSSEEARNVLTGEAVETGEALVGVSRSVYERTAFIGQAKLHIDGDLDTEKLILSVASGEDEGASTAEIISRIEKRRRALRSPRGLGTLSEVEREAERLQNGELSDGLAELREKWHAQELCASKAETALASAQLECSKAEVEMSSFPAFEGMSDSRAKIAAAQDIERLQEMRRKRVPHFAGIPLAVSAACAILVVTVDKMFAIPAAVFAVVALLLTCLFVFKHIRARKGLEAEMRVRYGSAKTEDIENALKAYISAFCRLEEAETKVQKLKKEARRAKTSADMMENEFRKAELRAKSSASARLTELLTQKEQLSLEFEALELAARIMQEADTELRSRFSPGLEKCAAEIFSTLTDGSFDTVRIKDSDFDMDVAKGAASAPKSRLFLSQGTSDALYLALRLALCKTITDKEDAPPIILDDALVNSDDARMARTLMLLKEFSKSRQVILFSCHSREAKFFEGDDEVNKISI